MEPTVIIALITAFAAIIAPVITAVINNKNNLKMKELEVKEEQIKSIDLHEREVLEKALSGIGILISRLDFDSTKDACQNIAAAIAYVDAETGASLREFLRVAADMESTIPDWQCSNVCNKITEEIARRTRRPG
ncbi:MAG: hypothetical protein IK150_03340 [Lachnospiraceae bacterium]|nr:hypothetical protein [Lachnospiraceae bacterium]